MIEVAVTKLSSKGQIVIPLKMRKDFVEGEKIIIIKSGKQIIMKRMKDADKNFDEDVEFARKTEEAFRKYEKGEFVGLDGKDFLKELELW